MINNSRVTQIHHTICAFTPPSDAFPNPGS